MNFKDFLRDCCEYIANTQPKREYNYIEVASGKTLNFNNLENSEITIEDIAHGLSMICRFSGHIDRYYSVAQHSLLVEHIVAQAGGTTVERLQALLHDSTEAFMGDLSTPLKDLLPLYQKMESLLNEQISSSIDINTKELPDIVYSADHMALCIEARQLLSDGSWAEEVEFKQSVIGVTDESGYIQSLHPELGKGLFLNKYERLMEKFND